jgi:hypothetical protein
MELEIKEIEGKFHVVVKVKSFLFFTKLVTAKHYKTNADLIFDHRRSAQCYINFQKNPRLKK